MNPGPQAKSSLKHKIKKKQKTNKSSFCLTEKQFGSITLQFYYFVNFSFLHLLLPSNQSQDDTVYSVSCWILTVMGLSVKYGWKQILRGEKKKVFWMMK